MADDYEKNNSCIYVLANASVESQGYVFHLFLVIGISPRIVYRTIVQAVW